MHITGIWIKYLIKEKINYAKVLSMSWYWLIAFFPFFKNLIIKNNFFINGVQAFKCYTKLFFETLTLFFNTFSLEFSRICSWCFSLYLNFLSCLWRRQFWSNYINIGSMSNNSPSKLDELMSWPGLCNIFVFKYWKKNQSTHGLKLKTVFPFRLFFKDPFQKNWNYSWRI